MADISGKITPSQDLETRISPLAPELDSNVNTEDNLTSNVSTNAGMSGTVNASGAVSPESLSVSGNLRGGYIPDTANGYGYVYIRYSHDYPTQDSDMLVNPDEDTKYLGIVGLNSPYPPTSYTRYQWSLIRGQDGDKGDQGDQGDKGESGDAEITIQNGFNFTGTLKLEDWQIDNTRDKSFYFQRVNVTDRLLAIIAERLQEQEANIGEGTIYNTFIEVIESTVPITDLIVSQNIETGLDEIENWKYISRAYLMREDYIDESYGYFMCFECYGDKPKRLLNFQVKVI